MTSEEFYGHLQSLLAGPKGGEVAALMLNKALIHDPSIIGQIVGETMADATADIQSDVLNLQLHAHLSALGTKDDQGKQLDPQQHFKAVSHRMKILGKIRTSLRDAMRKGGEMGRAAAAAVFLTLD